jgi:hypothetical protein
MKRGHDSSAMRDCLFGSTPIQESVKAPRTVSRPPFQTEQEAIDKMQQLGAQIESKLKAIDTMLTKPEPEKQMKKPPI